MKQSFKRKILFLSCSLLFLCSCADIAKKKSNDPTKTKDDVSGPLLTRPEVKKFWVDDRVEGNRYIEGHYEYTIEKNSTWSKL